MSIENPFDNVLPTTSETEPTGKYVETRTREELIERFKNGDFHGLHKMEEIDEEIADIISESKEEEIHLDSLNSLPENIAKKLAKYTGELRLNKLSSISNEVAEILSKHKGNLCLERLTSLSDEAAGYLTQIEGDLSLISLDIRTISDVAAGRLAKYEANKNEQALFKKIMELSNYGDEGWGIVNQLKTINDEIAEKISKHDGQIYLEKITSLSDSVAELLSKHPRDLYFDRLVSLTETAARHLAKHEWPIHFNNPKLEAQVNSFRV